MDSSDPTYQNKEKNKRRSLKLKSLEITSTGLFRCPISLEVMRSPVSLSTGVTYDRSSIQKWLDSGHRTCPATCQPLSSTDLVPNLALRHLIGLCFDTPPDQLVVPDETDGGTVGMVGTEVLSLLDETDRERSECIVVNLASIDGEMKEKVVSLLVENLDDSISALIRVLKKGNTIESRIAASRLIESVLASPLCDNESKVQITERIKLLNELISLIRDGKNQNGVLTGLECMLTLIESNDKKKLRAEMVKSGAIPTLVMVIKSSETPAEVASKAMRLLEQASRCKDGLQEIVAESKGIIEILTEKMMRVGRDGREAAVGTIWVMCSNKGGGSDVREVMKKMSGLVGRLLMVMQEDISPVVAMMAGDLLRICVGERGKEGRGPAGNYTKTMHIMPF